MAKKGAMKRDPKVSTQPVRGEGEQAVGDRATRRAAERAARRTPTERLSPGVYRSASGDLVGQGGRPIRRQPQAPMGAAEMGQQFAQMPGQAEGLGQQLGQAAGAANMGQQTNKPFDMSQYNPEQMQAQDMARQLAIQAGGQPGQIQSGMYWNPNFNPESIGKTPPGWSGGGSYDPSLNQGPMQNLVYRMPQGMPQMPQPSANQGGQYRLSPGVYGSREQAMRQYEQQLPSLYDQFTGNSVPQGMRRR